MPVEDVDELELSEESLLGRPLDRAALLRMGAGAAVFSVPLFAGAAGVARGSTGAGQKTITLHYLNHWRVGNDAHSKVMNDLINTFNRRHPGIKVVSDDVDYQTTPVRTKADCASGKCPDIIHQTEYLYVKSGWLLNLDPYVKGAWKNRFIPATLRPQTYNGHLYSFPMEVSPLPNIWNRKLIADLGAKVPTTWDEFVDLGTRAKAKGLYLFSLGSHSHMLNDLVWGYPGGPSAMATGQWDSPPVRFALTRFKQLVDNKFNPPNDNDLDYLASVALFQQRKSLVFSDGGWTIGNNLTPAGQDKFGLADEVAFSPGLKTIPGSKRATRYFSNGVGIAASLRKDPAKLRAALTFMNFWTSKPEATKWLSSQSPTGVRVPFPKQYPLLAGLFGAADRADLVYTSSVPLFMRQAVWTHLVAPAQAIINGKSVDDAVKIYVDQQKKAASA
jgi:ABC-type glycerol-3-phosphate transport system substrate-binding protein